MNQACKNLRSIKKKRALLLSSIIFAVAIVMTAVYFVPLSSR